MCCRILNIICFFLLSATGVWAQQIRPDSNWQKAIDAADSLAKINPAKAEAYLDTIKEKLPEKQVIKNAWYEKKLGIIFDNKPYIEAELYLREWLDFSRQWGDSDNVAFCMARLGHIFFLKKQYARAIEYELYALKLAEVSSTLEATKRSGIYASLTNLYLELDYFDKAKVFADSCLQIRLREKKGPASLAQAYAFLGESSLGLGDTSSASGYFETGIRLEPNGYTWLLYKGMGQINMATNQPSQALMHFEKAITLFQTAQRTKIRPIPLLELKRLKAEAQYQMKAYNESIETLNEALSNVNGVQLPVAARYEINGLLAKNYYAVGSFTLSADYFSQYQAVADSVSSEVLNKRLLSVKEAFESNQKEQEIKYLNNAAERIKRERNFLIGGTALLIGLLGGIAWLLRQRKIYLLQLEARHKQTENLLEEKTKLVKQLEHTQAHLIQQEKLASLGELTAGIAHELNNPINFIATNAYALETSLKEWQNQQQSDTSDGQLRDVEEIAALMAGIRRGCERSTAIINGLRLFARKGTGEISPADLHAGIDTCLLILNNKTRGFIEVEFQKSLIPQVYCRFEAINQVFMNILSNAVDELLECRPPSPQINIITKAENGIVEIAIKDNGRGIPNDILPRIFEPFFTTKPAGKGTGLGLAISYGIIQQHSGQLTVKSLPGGGSVFTIRLPVNYSASL